MKKYILAAVFTCMAIACGSAESPQTDPNAPRGPESSDNAAAGVTENQSVKPDAVCLNTDCNNNCRKCGAKGGSCQYGTGGYLCHCTGNCI
ncbi:MAG TPA: hypothetical protein VGI39_33525 [Polyangiaceae bacterium]|jgi:hypothetical protein